MKTPMKFGTAALLVLLAVRPAYPENKELLQLQRDMIELQQRIKQIQTTMDLSDAALKGLVEKMADQVNTLAGGMQRITQAVDGVKTQTDASAREMRTLLTTLNTTITEMKDDLSSVRGQINSLSQQVTTIKTTAEPLAGLNDLWKSAYVDYFSGIYENAIGGFQEFLSKYPNDQRAAEANLLIGDALYAQKKFDQAINQYDIVLQKYPESDKTRAALLKKGLAQAETNQPQAKDTLNEVVKKFPSTSEAYAAQTKLKELLAPARKAPAR